MTSTRDIVLSGAFALLALSAGCQQGYGDFETESSSDSTETESSGSMSSGDVTTSDAQSKGSTSSVGEVCGNGVVEEGEACDDGVNDGSYGGCNQDCTLAPYCGDGELNGALEACDDANTDSADGCLVNCAIPRSCTDILYSSDGAPNGVYVIDPDGAGEDVDAFQVYCNMTLAGGGWQLISSRFEDTGALFANYMCTDVESNCSGTIRDGQVRKVSPDLLFATNDSAYWIRLTGLAPPGSNALMDVITLDRQLTEVGCGAETHYCSSELESLSVVDSSSNFTPRYALLPLQSVSHGGLWLGNDVDGPERHVLSLNRSSPCSPGGLDLSDNSDDTEANVVCGVPGAVYFRY